MCGGSSFCKRRKSPNAYTGALQVHRLLSANFTGANMTLADLESGNFEDADFTNAVLAGAFVNNAQFKGVNITNTDWSDVVLRKDQQMFLCKLANGTNPTQA
ncbi:hypothetical protein COO60DRAFT_1496233, partial [Scenedesmus sp. NREL 46B-D3]